MDILIGLRTHSKMDLAASKQMVMEVFSRKNMPEDIINQMLKLGCIVNFKRDQVVVEKGERPSFMACGISSLAPWPARLSLSVPTISAI